MPRLLYHTFYGRCLLKVITLPVFSKMAGAFMNSEFSRPYIKRFIKKNNIDLSEYKIENWQNFNEFFTRRFKAGKRTPVMSDNVLIAPCDGYISAYDITENSVFQIKGTPYTISELLEDDSLEGEYKGGLCLIFRLTPSDYHRYIYPDSGAKGKNTSIAGKLHTVRPLAHDFVPVYKTNSREYTILRTNNFDDIVFMEVGAMLVGKICNYHQEHNFKRGEEKGKFEFGGSTIIMLIKKSVAEIDEDIRATINTDCEIRVKLGEQIGKKK